MNRPGASGALALSTLAFAISFACWEMITLLAKTFQAELGLSEAQVWTLIAVPVLLGSLGRLPMGMLADRSGGRLVFGLLLIGTAISAFRVIFAHSYPALVPGFEHEGARGAV